LFHGGDEMINFPVSSSVGRILPKEAFYKRLNLSLELKKNFVTDIRRINVENSLTENTLNLKPGAEVTEILVLGLDLKNQTIDNRILEIISRQNQHKIIFLLRFDGQGQLALYQSKLYKTEWQPIGEMILEMRGFNLDQVWDGFVEQIALVLEAERDIKEASVDCRLRRQEDIQRLEKKIFQLEKAARAEKRPKKKFEMAMQVQQLNKKLDEL
jgi:hypothetical protein